MSNYDDPCAPPDSVLKFAIDRAKKAKTPDVCINVATATELLKAYRWKKKNLPALENIKALVSESNLPLIVEKSRKVVRI